MPKLDARRDVVEPAPGRGVVRVLIVDANRDFGENLAELARLSGLSPVICASCAEARSLLAASTFDIAIVEQQLPDGEGVDLMAELKRRCPDIVTIVVTAFVSLDHTLAALNQGAFAFLSKDSDPEELLEIVVRAAENAKLRQENRGLRDLREAILRVLPDLLLLVDESLRVVSVNRRHAVFCPREPADAAGRPVHEVIAPFLREKLELGALLREAHARSVEAERTVEARDESGRLWILGLRAVPLQTTGEPLMLVRVVDLTDRISLERQLTDAQHLAMLGRLVSSIAHEVRNPLAGIRALAQLLQRRLSGSPDDQESATEILGLTDRMHATLSDLLEFARPGAHREESIELVPLLESLLVEARHWPAAAERRLELVRRDGTAPRVVGARDRVFGAVANLVLNGLQATPSGGHVRITLGEDGHACEIGIEDSGPGIAADVLPRLFQPFFTTKTRGTGLGLSIVKKTVEALGGSIEVDGSQELGGARFRLRLPVAVA